MDQGQVAPHSCVGGAINKLFEDIWVGLAFPESLFEKFEALL
jgi:hypothetical protein